jgi:ribonuclease HI
MNNLIAYTDGSCKGNKNGGIGVLWIKNGKIIQEYSKGFKNVTNNIMELMAIYVALKCIIKPIDSLEIISDSEYSIGVLTKDWRPKKNIKLISIIKKEINRVEKLVPEIKWTHVRGHQKDDSESTKYNNKVDFLAQNAAIYEV